MNSVFLLELIMYAGDISLHVYCDNSETQFFNSFFIIATLSNHLTCINTHSTSNLYKKVKISSLCLNDYYLGKINSKLGIIF